MLSLRKCNFRLIGVGLLYISDKGRSWQYREGKHEHQFLGFVQDSTKFTSNHLWMFGSGHDSVSSLDSMWHMSLILRWTGVNVNNYYGPTIYVSIFTCLHRQLLISRPVSDIQVTEYSWSKVSPEHSVSSGSSYLCKLLTAQPRVSWPISTFIVDRIGRRRPMIIGAICLSAIMAWQAGASSPFDDPNYSNTSTGIAGIASIFIFSLVFSMSFGPGMSLPSSPCTLVESKGWCWWTVSWIYQSEIFPMNLRALGASASTASNWLNNVLISQITPYAFDAIGWRFFFVFMACNLSNAVLTYFLFPETKGKTLEEIGMSPLS